jgi:hypothetical protein
MFMKLIKILTGIFVFWFLFDSLHRLQRRNMNIHRVRGNDDGRTRRKFVESCIVKQ